MTWNPPNASDKADEGPVYPWVLVNTDLLICIMPEGGFSSHGAAWQYIDEHMPGTQRHWKCIQVMTPEQFEN